MTKRAPFIRVEAVEGLETILGFNPKSRPWEVLIDTAHLREKHKPDQELSRVADNKFYAFIKSHLEKSGLNIATTDNRPAIRAVYKRNGSMLFHVECEGTEIIPGREAQLDGYQPLLDFTVTPRTLSVVSYLRRKGSQDLAILEDFLKSCLKRGNGVTKPRIQLTKTGRIYVASFKFVPEVLTRLATIFQRINPKRLGELVDLQKEIRHCAQIGSVYVGRKLHQMYRDRKADLLS